SLNSGVGTFTATFKQLGTQTLTATDTLTGTITGTVSVSVITAPATHFTIGGPATVTAGSPLSLTVTALDQFNNPVTGHGGSVFFTTRDPKPVLPLNRGFSGGAGTSPAPLKPAGTATETATDPASVTVLGTSIFTVKAASAAQFTVTAPANTTP